ncbi:MAG: glycosyltransferase family 2 protein [Deltaproteobacteria bacterium]|nr:glycosyltransferase family 2 protein [Deltaproteobacteria bacterium]
MDTDTGRSVRPLLSIVVPTRNRATYAVPAIRSLLSIPSTDIQVVVQDNSDDPELERFVEALPSDPRLRYNHITERLDVIENFTRGTDLATGEYITYLGDDDGANPEILEATAWARGKKLDAILPSRPAQYWWPDHRFRYHGSISAGSMDLRPFTGKLSYPDPETEMRKCARAAGYHFAKLPRIYYGVVRRDCLNKVKMTAGTYFPGPSPDLSGAIAVANYVKAMAHVDYPLLLPGSSAKSTAGLGAMKKHVGRLEAWPHLPQQYVRNWSKLVPAFFGGNTIWGEDVVQALTAIGRKDILAQFNVPLLHAFCVAFNPQYSRLTIENFYRALRVTHKGYAIGTAQFIFAYGYAYLLRARTLADRYAERARLRRITTIRKLPSIEDAIQALSSSLIMAGRKFSACI